MILLRAVLLVLLPVMIFGLWVIIQAAEAWLFLVNDK